MRCPRCTYWLSVYTHGATELDHCDRCGGTFLDPGEAAEVFGELADPSSWKESWHTESLGPTNLQCPRDGERLVGHRVEFDKDRVEVDTCPDCHGLWLDAHEGTALYNLVSAAEDKARRRQMGIEKPGVASYLFQLFTGFPVEVWNPVRRKPVLVYSLIGILVAAFVVQLVLTPVLTEDPGILFMVPTQVLAGDRLWTIITSEFFHGGFAHIAGNLYFLWVFGDNVEDVLGKRRFIVLYMAALVAANLLHLVFESGSDIPTLGASGAISGVMGAYVVLFPKVKLYVMILFFRFSIGVIWYLGFWVVMQIGMAAMDMPGVAWMAHIGGFIAGAGIAAVWRGQVLRSEPKAV